MKISTLEPPQSLSTASLCAAGDPIVLRSARSRALENIQGNSKILVAKMTVSLRLEMLCDRQETLEHSQVWNQHKQGGEALTSRPDF